MNVLRFVLAIIRWPSLAAAIVLLAFAYNTPAGTWELFTLAASGIGLGIVFLLSLPLIPGLADPRPARLAKKQDPIDWALGPELSRFDRLDGVGNRRSEDPS